MQLHRLANAVKTALFVVGIGTLVSLQGCQPNTTPSANAGHNSDQHNGKNSAHSEATSQIAPGAPGAAPTWAFAGKTGIGTSYEAYPALKNPPHTATSTAEHKTAEQVATGTVSKVWFSLAQGILTETMYGLIHQAQLREMQFYVQIGDELLSEKNHTQSSISYMHTDAQGRPQSLAYRVTNRDKQGRFVIIKEFFTDPDQQSLVMRTELKALVPDVRFYLYADPHIGNTGTGDSAQLTDDAMLASDSAAQQSMALRTKPMLAKRSVGFVGASDGISALAAKQPLAFYQSTGDIPGNVAFFAEVTTLAADQSYQLDTVLGFGENAQQSHANASATLAKDLTQVANAYAGIGSAVGWQDYLAQLSELPSLAEQATDHGALLYSSALVLKAQEDKTHPGALIASLSNPWGDIKSAATAQTGYKAVWPRDFYQVAMAMLAMGDQQSPKVAFEYLQKVQVSANTPGYKGVPGWFLQKTHVDGTLEWVAVQLDQTAMPIMLGWQLWQRQLLSNTELAHWYQQMLKPAADFLANGGDVALDWNKTTITPPFTQQERWEEQEGFSPSTTAAVISGLVCAADIATALGDSKAAQLYLSRADQYQQQLDSLTFTEQGSLTQAPADGRYYVRINNTPALETPSQLVLRNGIAGADKTQYIDGGFLELVRYGVKGALDAAILATLPELDATQLPDPLRVHYRFTLGNGDTISGWRRYGLDGYGEDTVTGEGYANGPDQSNTAGQRGRVWPIFSGERGHYELAKAIASGGVNAQTQQQLRHDYVRAMEHFANEGLMLPEQVWDGIGNNKVYHYHVGEGTNGATPLAWSHAEYVKLLRSLRDKQLWDHYAPVAARYSSADSAAKPVPAAAK